MGKPFQIVDTTLLEKALDAASLRQRVIANNIANVNVAGYTPKAVVFESHLRQAMADGASVMSSGSSDKSYNFTPKNVVDPQFAITGCTGWTEANLKPTISTVHGKVDVNTEMANQAKNQILYNALADKISGIYGALQWIVENTGR